MFLTDPQLAFLREAKKGPVDLMNVNLCTLAALRARGIAYVDYRKTAADWSYVKLTEIGQALAAAEGLLKTLPTYKDALKEMSPHKKFLRTQKHETH
jgi:hypothetical protein